MKPTIALLLGLCPILFAPTAFGQTTRPDAPPERRAADPGQRGTGLRLGDLTGLRNAVERHDLDEATRARVLSALDGALADLRRLSPALRALEPRERRSRFRALRRDIETELLTLLPQETWREIARAAREPAPRDTPRPDVAPDTPVTAYLQALADLEIDDEADRRKVRSVINDVRQDLQRLSELSDSPRRDEEAREVFAEARAELAEILSPQQRLAVTRAVASAMANSSQDSEGSDRPSPRVGGQAGRYLDRLMRTVDQLELTDAQRGELQAATDTLRSDLRDAVEQHRGDREALTKATRELLTGFRGRLGRILTADQQSALRESMGRRGSRQSPPSRPPAGAAMEPEGAMAGGGMMGEAAGDRVRQPLAPPAADRFLSRLTSQGGLTPGQPLPAGLTVLTLRGQPVPLADHLAKDRPTILILGSASSPSFRDRMTDLPWLLERLDTPFGSAADVVLVYTREQYPAASWDLDRNRRDGFVLPQHETPDERVETAVNFRQWAGLDRPHVTVLADSMDDATRSAVAGEAGDATGNYVLVIDPAGTVVGRQRWFDPTGLVPLVEAALDEG
jgi:hypothetical protein